MQEHVPSLPFAVDPLIAEAKRRRRRRWLLTAVAIGAAAAAVIGITYALQAPSHRLTTPPARRVGFARIPGMTMIASDHLSNTCVLFRLPRSRIDDLPAMGDCESDPYGVGVAVGSHLDQVWVLRSAAAKLGVGRLRRTAFGPPERRFPAGPVALAQAIPLPSTLTRRHPGPLEVQVRVRTGQDWNPQRGPLGFAGSRDEANGLLHAGFIGGSSGRPASHFVPLPAWTINSGLAGRLETPENHGMTRFQFAWAAGTRVVLVDVLGHELTVRAAQQVAALAGPSAG